jgi:Flp pilus assembly protein CpaB
METNTIVMLFAVVAALGLVTVVAVDFIILQQEAEAKGCSGGGIGFNASKGKCLKL